MVYSSGTTGRPKGVRIPLPEGEVTASHKLAEMSASAYGMGPDTVYLSPAPLYHTAPLAYTTSTHRLGGTVIVMPRFEPEAALVAIEQFGITHVQMVPTMFVRLLKLPADVRQHYDLSSLEVVVHAAAPCPVEIKQSMFDWLGPIIYEYYGGSEGNGSTRIGPEEWLRKPGSVGKASWGIVHICDDDGNELPVGAQGIVFFEGGWDFKYLGDETKTRDSRNPLHPSWSTLGDVGYLDEDGYLLSRDNQDEKARQSR
jgi:long-chain acyl-CoA synthetase